MISKSKSGLLSLLSTIFVLTLNSTVNSSPAAAGEKLPFHATLQGKANPVPTGECTLANTETGSGVALHLGKWTWSDQESVQFLSCPPPGSAIAVTGQFVMVAANGDEIDGTFETSGTFDPVNGVSVQGGYTFVSGTGPRFGCTALRLRRLSRWGHQLLRDRGRSLVVLQILFLTRKPRAFLLSGYIQEPVRDT